MFSIVIGIAVVILKMLVSASDNEYGTFLLSGSNLKWPSVFKESKDILYGRYEPRKILINGMQMDDKRVYVTMPRFAKTGVPWSLGVFRLDVADFEPDIQPFPGYEYYESCKDGGSSSNKTCIVNVVDVYVEDGILWALDTGMTNILRRQPWRLGPAQLVSINLTTDIVIEVVNLSAVTWPDSLLEHVVARRTLSGRLFVYVSDASRHNIIVYDVCAKKVHTVPLPETISTAHYHRVTLYLMDVNRSNRSFVYFTFRQSCRVYALDAWSRESVVYGSVSEIPGIKPVDMVMLGSDRGTTVYFRSASGTDVWAWDVNRPLDLRNFVLVHRAYLYLMPTAVATGWGRSVWALESNYDEYIAGSVDCTGARTLLRPLKQPVDGCNDELSRV